MRLVHLPGPESFPSSHTLSLQWCPALCHPDDSPPGSSDHGFSKQEYWGCRVLLQGPSRSGGQAGTPLRLPHWQASSLPLVPPGTPCILHYKPAILLSKNVLLSLPAVLQVIKPEKGSWELLTCSLSARSTGGLGLVTGAQSSQSYGTEPLNLGSALTPGSLCQNPVVLGYPAGLPQSWRISRYEEKTHTRLVSEVWVKTDALVIEYYF